MNDEKKINIRRLKTARDMGKFMADYYYELDDASKSGKRNFLGEGELVDDVANGRLNLSKLGKDKLPEPLQSMAPAEQEAMIAERAEQRDELQRRIKEVSAKRARYLKAKVEERGGARASLDYKLYSTVREQAEAKGMTYDTDGLNY